MNNGQSTIAVLLTVVAVLLGLNLIVRGSPSAGAQVASGPVQAVPVSLSTTQLIGVSVNDWHIFRLWSDGAVDSVRVTYTSGSGCDIESQCDLVPILPGTCMADVDNNGAVNSLDLIDVLLALGTTCP